MTSPFCDIYSGTGTKWPVRMFPASRFPRGSPARLREAARAWVFFEQVEAYDAAMRVKYSTLGGFTPSDRGVVTQAPWYAFKGEGERVQYKRGQSLHRELCPDTNWTPQRNLGIPVITLTNVYPDACFDVSDGEVVREFSIMHARGASPALSGHSGSIKEVSTLGSTTSPSLSGRTSEGPASTNTSSRRDSISDS